MVKKWISNNRILVFVLFIGFLLRIIPIFWGIPISPYVRSYHPDEPKVYESILHFPGVYLTTHPFAAYGTTVQYILGTLLLPVKFILAKVFALRELYSIVVWIVARLASVVMGTATIYLTYRLSEKLFDQRVALLSSLFLAVSFFHVLNSSIITVDVAMAFFLVINILLCFRAIEENRMSPYLWLGIFTGLLVGTKLPAGIFVVIPLFLMIHQVLEHSERRRQKISQFKFLSIYGGVALLVFFVFHPHILIDLGKFIDFYVNQKLNWMDRVQTSISGLFPLWTNQTIRAVGAPVFILALGGVLIPGKKNLRYKIAIIIFLACYFGFWRWAMKARYIIMIAPVICMFAAYICLRLMSERNRVLKWTGGAVIAIVLVFSVYNVMAGIYLRLNDTRPLAARYISENVPAGTTLGIAGVSEKYTWKTHPWEYPEVDFKRYKEVDFLEYPEIVILSSYAYKSVLRTLASQKLGPGYVLDEVYNREWYRFSAPTSRIFRFYDELMNLQNGRYVLLRKFDIDVKVPLEFAPPEIRIYKRVET